MKELRGPRGEFENSPRALSGLVLCSVLWDSPTDSKTANSKGPKMQDLSIFSSVLQKINC